MRLHTLLLNVSFLVLTAWANRKNVPLSRALVGLVPFCIMPIFWGVGPDQRPHILETAIPPGWTVTVHDDKEAAKVWKTCEVEAHSKFQPDTIPNPYIADPFADLFGKPAKPARPSDNLRGPFC